MPQAIESALQQLMDAIIDDRLTRLGVMASTTPDGQWPEFMKLKTVSDYCEISEPEIRRGVREGWFPSSVSYKAEDGNRTMRWKKTHVDKWIRQRK